MKHTSMIYPRSKIVIGILLLFLGSCGHGYLDDPGDTSQSACHRIGVEGDPDLIDRPSHVGKVLLIRLANDGRFVDRCELTNVLYELNWERRYGSTLSPTAVASRPKFVVLYIHGWKHDYSSQDNDLIDFQELIAKLDHNLAGEKQVLGVYIGWNAKPKIPPFNFIPFNNLTFWSKSTVADRIAQTGVVTRILGSIASVLSYDVPGSYSSSDNQFVAIGHSFGARMLFSATNQTLIYQTERAHPGRNFGEYGRISGAANAIILVNPAFEAARFTPLASYSRFKENFVEDQPPLLLSVSSDGDWATQMAFPVGQVLGTYTSVAERTTLGNYKEYQTHTLRVADRDDCGAGESSDLSEVFFAKGLCLSRGNWALESGKYQQNNPYIIASTSTSIISGHNDIWNPVFSDWLFEFIRKTGEQSSCRLLDKKQC